MWSGYETNGSLIRTWGARDIIWVCFFQKVSTEHLSEGDEVTEVGTGGGGEGRAWPRRS